MYVRYAIATTLLLGFAGLAAAQAVAPEGSTPPATGAGEETAATTAAPAQGMSLQEVIAALEGQGYTDFREVEHEDRYYEVKARNRDGRLVEVYVSPETGQIVRSERESRERKGRRD